jgi:hypothetical protein
MANLNEQPLDRQAPLRPSRPHVVAAAVIAIAALAAGVYWVRTGPAPLPSGQPLTIVTEPKPNDSGLCLQARLGGAQMRRSGTQVLFSASNGEDVAITWPYGTTALLVDGQAELFAPDRTLIAAEGQTLPDLGGGLGVDDRFHVCHIGDRLTLSIANQTTIAVTLVVNGKVIEIVPAGSGRDPITAELPGLPWDVETRSPSGRVLSRMTVNVGDVSITEGAAKGDAVRVDLSCGRLDVWSGPPLLGPPFVPGPSGDCE